MYLVYGILDGRCLKCNREFNLPTSLRNHCKQKCGPEYLPKRHLPKKLREGISKAGVGSSASCT